uniref:Uncharacterized protein n=1 Tax=Acropora millepora TaxID=45264 RepID=G8HTB5_ACRMI|nr:hypothetical protein A014-G2 [Acropora millepora]
MDVKLNVCLLLLLVGALCVQGFGLRKRSKNEPTFMKRERCGDSNGGISVSNAYECYELEPPRQDCPYHSPTGRHCCCRF